MPGEIRSGRNLRTVWEIATAPYPEAHFATFPPAIPERCIKAGTSEKGCCPKCGAPWKRVVEKKYKSPLIKGDFIKEPNCFKGDKSNPRERAADGTFLPRPYASPPGNTRDAIKRMGDGVDITIIGWTPTCYCFDYDHPKEPIPCTVFDPFSGAGTTCLVAAKLGRDAIGIELSPKYVEMSRKRLIKELGFMVEMEIIKACL